MSEPRVSTARAAYLELMAYGVDVGTDSAAGTDPRLSYSQVTRLLRIHIDHRDGYRA